MIVKPITLTVTGVVCKEHQTNTDTNGVTTYHLEYTTPEANRYVFDRLLCGRGFKQYDTTQDAWYFGVWVHVRQRLVVTYAEGDLTEVHLHNHQNFRDYLTHMANFYGPPPPAFRVYTLDGQVTEVFDARPEPENNGAELVCTSTETVFSVVDPVPTGSTTFYGVGKNLPTTS